MSWGLELHCSGLLLHNIKEQKKKEKVVEIVIQSCVSQLELKQVQVCTGLTQESQGKEGSHTHTHSTLPFFPLKEGKKHNSHNTSAASSPLHFTEQVTTLELLTVVIHYFHVALNLQSLHIKHLCIQLFFLFLPSFIFDIITVHMRDNCGQIIPCKHLHTL